MLKELEKELEEKSKEQYNIILCTWDDDTFTQTAIYINEKRVIGQYGLDLKKDMEKIMEALNLKATVQWKE